MVSVDDLLVSALHHRFLDRRLPAITGLLLCLLHVDTAQASKFRSWLDSFVTLMEGSQPSPRYGHGFAATEDGKMHVFGGYGAEGTQRGVSSGDHPYCIGLPCSTKCTQGGQVTLTSPLIHQ